MTDSCSQCGHLIEDAEQEARKYWLTPGEKECLRLLLDGKTNREIAVASGIEERTVKGRIGHIMRKFEVTSRIGIVAMVLLPLDSPLRTLMTVPR